MRYRILPLLSTPIAALLLLCGCGSQVAAQTENAITSADPSSSTPGAPIDENRPAAPPPRVSDETLSSFVDTLSAKHAFNRDELLSLLRHAQIRDDILAAMDRPAEAKPWHEYRLIFLTDERIHGGVDFMRKHAKLLREAEKMYGVPRQIITAIIGVETRYGLRTGNFRVVDALFTLAFLYPKRSDFFRKELEEFLLLAREENRDPLTLSGSYAGAMGIPQFMPSSFRRYAVDFDADKKRDIWQNPADAIGSVANYFKVHGWEKGQPVVTPARIVGPKHEALLAAGIKPHIQVRALPKQDVRLPRKQKGDLLAALFELEEPTAKKYWIGFNNFYVITRYNRSNLYAMAVYQLSEEILKHHTKPAKKSARTAAPAAKPVRQPAPAKPTSSPAK